MAEFMLRPRRLGRRRGCNHHNHHERREHTAPSEETDGVYNHGWTKGKREGQGQGQVPFPSPLWAGGVRAGDV